MEQTQNKVVSLSVQKKSSDQKEDPFAISVGPITRLKSHKLIEKIACLVHSQESEEEQFIQTTINANHFHLPSCLLQQLV